MSSGETLLAVNGVELCVEAFGARADPAILLIGGAAASMLWWEEELCERIAAGGRYVIRFDNRDTGRSVSYPPGRPGYAMSDLVEDAVGILDALGLDRAHVVGCSWAGGMAAAAALRHPDRVASLTLLSTSTGEAGLPPPDRSLGEVPEAPDPDDAAAVVAYVTEVARVYAGGSPLHDADATRALVERDVARTAGVGSCLVNHYAMEFDVELDFGAIAAPALVVHGDRDPLFPPAHGEALRDVIPGARLVVLHDVGHELPRPAWDEFVAALLEHTG